MAKLNPEDIAVLEQLSRGRAEQEKKNSKQFELLGRYVAIFEGIMEQIKTFILVVQQSHVLKDRNIEVTISSNASKLIIRFNKMLKDWLRENASAQAEKLGIDCQQRLEMVLQDRNNFVHGFWFNVAPENEEQSLGVKFVHHARGTDNLPLPSIKELDSKVEELYLLLHLIYYLREYVRTRDESLLSNNFDFSAQGMKVYRFTQF